MPLPKISKSPAESGIPEQETPTAESSDEAWLKSLSKRDGSLLTLMMSHDELRAALIESAVVEVRAADDESRKALLPTSARVEVNASDAAEAQAAVRALRDGLTSMLIHDTLQFLTETRQFLGLCFSKLAVGGMMIVTVPHQFLFERKLRLPSRRNPLHRRFYTPEALLRDIEEAIDPCEYRVRFLGENDFGYDYRAGLSSDPDGGQDIVVGLERIAVPPWRANLGADEIWAESPKAPSRIPELGKNEPGQLRVVSPEAHTVKRIILVKLDHRGDFILGMEAFKTFRDAFGQAEITLVCGPWNVAEAKASGYFDKILPFAFFPEDDSARALMRPREELIADFARRMEGESYDLAVDLRLFDDTRPVVQAIKARDRAGFDRHDSFPWLTIRLNTPSATEDDRAEEIAIPASRFRTSVGRHRTFEIRCEVDGKSESHPVLWGPYEDLGPGRYRLEWLVEALKDDFDLSFDVVADRGERTLIAGKVRATRKEYPVVHLRIPSKTEKVEFKVRGGEKSDLKPFRFLGVRLTRLGLERGLHQSEAMTLLAHLARLRTSQPYNMQMR